MSKPYLVGALFIGVGLIGMLADRPTRGKYGWTEPGVHHFAGFVMAAAGTWLIISALRRGRKRRR